MMYEELVKRLRIGTKCFPGYILYPGGGVQPFYLTPKDLEQAAEAIEDLDNKLNLYRQGKISRWIPITERRPDKRGDYLVFTSDSTITVATWGGEHFYMPEFAAVTHWMSLPQPPEDSE